MDCSGSVGIGDAILLARYLAEDDVTVTAVGKVYANCYIGSDDPDKLNADDLTVLVSYLAGSFRTLPVYPDED